MSTSLLPIERVRVAIFSALTAVILVGPAYGHFFAEGKLEHLGWKMYRVRALGFCAVDYRRRMPDGSDERIDRFALLGFGRFGGDNPPPFELWRIASPESAHEWAAQMCARLGPGADLRTHIRCATVDGWRDEEGGGRNWCR
jgi:hypothetical protein